MRSVRRSFRAPIWRLRFTPSLLLFASALGAQSTVPQLAVNRDSVAITFRDTSARELRQRLIAIDRSPPYQLQQAATRCLTMKKHLLIASMGGLLGATTGMLATIIVGVDRSLGDSPAPNGNLLIGGGTVVGFAGFWLATSRVPRCPSSSATVPSTGATSR